MELASRRTRPGQPHYRLTCPHIGLPTPVQAALKCFRAHHIPISPDALPRSGTGAYGDICWARALRAHQTALLPCRPNGKHKLG
jgi:hypothetical protein